MKHVIVLILLIFYCGIVPREIQTGAPTVFMFGGVIFGLFLYATLPKVFEGLK